MKVGEINRVLYIDLNRKDISIEDRSDLFDAYIGGSGVAIKLLRRSVPGAWIL